MRAPDDWVPAGVRQVADCLLASCAWHAANLDRACLAHIDDERARITRLLTDLRMRSVWRELAKRPGSPAARDQFVGASPDELSGHDIAVGVFFYHANYYVQGRFATETFAAVNERVRPFLKSVERLRQEAEAMGDWFGPESDHVAAIKAAADLWEREILAGYGKPHLEMRPLVGRNQGDPHLRGYALMVANKAHELFGRWMYETVATVTNVALPRRTEVSKANVRDWVRLHRKS